MKLKVLIAFLNFVRLATCRWNLLSNFPNRYLCLTYKYRYSVYWNLKCVHRTKNIIYPRYCDAIEVILKLMISYAIMKKKYINENCQENLRQVDGCRPQCESNMTYLSVLLVAGDDQNETQSRIVYLEGDWSHS